MNYLNIYYSIILKAKQRSSIIIGENHHIIPQSLETSSFAINFLQPFKLHETVLLTTKEHFLSHLLLMKMFKSQNSNCYRRMTHAVEIMATSRHFSSRKYAWARKHYSLTQSAFKLGKPSPAKGKKWSAEAKARKSLLCPTRGKTYEEIYGPEKANKLRERRRKDMSKNLTNKGLKFSPRTEEQRKRYSESALKKYANGFTHPKTDHKQYLFKNVNTTEERTITREQFKKSMSGDFHYLITTTDSISRSGWMFMSVLES